MAFWLIATAALALFMSYVGHCLLFGQRRHGRDLGWLPVLGSLPFAKLPLEEHLAQQYPHEDVVIGYYGLAKIHFLNSFKAMREALVAEGDKFLARPEPMLTRGLTGEDGGIIMTSGQEWQDYRRFSLRTLRDFGFGRRGAEEIVKQEARCLCEVVDAANGQALETTRLFSTATSNVICQLVFGSRLASEEPKFERIREIFQKMTQPRGSFNLSLLIIMNARLFRFLPPVLRLLRFLRRDTMNVFKELTDFCSEQVAKHRAELQEGQEPKDYIDAHLLHQETHSEFNETRLMLSITDLFLAGTDTTAHTLKWAVIFMLENPDVADALFKEISEQVGTERQVGLSDRQKLPMMMAAIEEVIRLSCLVPLGLWHQATEDANVCGHEIRKGENVMYNLYHIHHNKEVFPEPELFKPQRYLNEEGKFSPCEHVAAFGLGKRNCLGESLARTELFIIFATLMQRYTFQLGGDLQMSDLPEIKRNSEYRGGGIRTPGSHTILFSRRD